MFLRGLVCGLGGLFIAGKGDRGERLLGGIVEDVRRFWGWFLSAARKSPGKGGVGGKHDTAASSREKRGALVARERRGDDESWIGHVGMRRWKQAEVLVSAEAEQNSQPNCEDECRGDQQIGREDRLLQEWQVMAFRSFFTCCELFIVAKNKLCRIFSQLLSNYHLHINV